MLGGQHQRQPKLELPHGPRRASNGRPALSALLVALLALTSVAAVAMAPPRSALVPTSTSPPASAADVVLQSGSATSQASRDADAFAVEDAPSEDAPSLERSLALPTYFEPNVGQAVPEAVYVGHTAGLDVLFLRDAIRFVSGTSATTLDLRGVSPLVLVEGREALSAFTNYFTNPDGRTALHAPHFAKVAYRDAWPGIDLVFYANGDGMEFDALVAAGADTRQVGFASEHGLDVAPDGTLRLLGPIPGLSLQAPHSWQGETQAAVDSAWRLGLDGTASFQLGAYDMSRPLVIDPRLGYSSFFGGASQEFFRASKAQLENGAWFLYATGMTNSTAKCAPLAACPPAFGSTLTSTGGLVAKFRLATDGTSSLEWLAVIGGNLRPNDIDTDGTRVYITGTAFLLTSPSANAYSTMRMTHTLTCTTVPLAWDAFVTVLSADGQIQVYNSYVGGVADDYATGIDAGGGHPVITGATQWINSVPYPSKDGFQMEHAGPPFQGGTICGSGVNVGGYDSFLSRFDPDAAGTTPTTGNPASLVWSTYVGGGLSTAFPTSSLYGQDVGWDVAVDGNDDVWVVGQTSSQVDSQPAFPLLDSEQPLHGGGITDAFIVQVSGDGKDLLYGSFFGGNLEDKAYSLALTPSRLLVVGGTASGTAFRFNGTGYRTTGYGGIDGFVSAFTLNPVDLDKTTLLGTTGIDQLTSVQVDGTGNVNVEGATGAGSSFPTVHAWPNLHGSGTDYTGTRFDPNLQTLQFSTAIGSSQAETTPVHAGTLAGIGSGLATDIVLAGGTPSATAGYWPIASSASNTNVRMPALNSFHRTMTSGATMQGVVARFISPSEPWVACSVVGPNPHYIGVPISFTWAPTGVPHTQAIETYDAAVPDANYGLDPASLQWDYDFDVAFDPDAATTGQSTPSYTYPAATATGLHLVKFQAADTQGRVGSATCPVTLSVLPPLACGPVTQARSIGQATNVNATGGWSPYSWSAPGGTPASGAGSVFTTAYATAGPAIITVTDAMPGGARTATCAVSVSSVASLACTPTSWTVLPNAPARFSAAGGIPPYTWSAPQAISGTVAGNDFTATYGALGAYDVSVQDSQGGAPTLCHVTVSATAPPPPPPEGGMAPPPPLTTPPVPQPYAAGGTNQHTEKAPPDGAETGSGQAVDGPLVPPPVADIRAPSWTLPGQPLALDGSGSQGVGLRYAWQQLDGPSALLDGAATPFATLHAPEGTGILLFELRVEDQMGRTDTRAVQVLLLGRPAITAAPLPDGALAFATDWEGTHAWDFGDGAKGQGPNPIHKYDQPGTYHVTLQAMDPDGHASTAATDVQAGASSHDPLPARSAPAADHASALESDATSLAPLLPMPLVAAALGAILLLAYRRGRPPRRDDETTMPRTEP